MAEWIRHSETVMSASGLHRSGCVCACVISAAEEVGPWLLPTFRHCLYNQAWKLEYGHQPLTSLMSPKGAQEDSATKTAKGGKGREGRRGVCCHGERFSKQLLIRLCRYAPLSILLPSLSLSPTVCPLCYGQPLCL